MKLMVLIAFFIGLFSNASIAQTMNSEEFKRNLEIWKSLPDQTKMNMKNNYKKWKSLSPEKREVLAKNYSIYQKLPEERKSKIQKNLKLFKELPVDKQKIIQERIQRLNELSPDERSQRLEKLRKFRQQKLQQAMLRQQIHQNSENSGEIPAGIQQKIQSRLNGSSGSSNNGVRVRRAIRNLNRNQ